MAERMNMLQGPSKMYFSYSQFLVYDGKESNPACCWNEIHSAQGFARRKNSICFGTLLEFGYANINITAGEYYYNKYHERVITVPLNVISGEIRIDGPEEYPLVRKIMVLPDCYKIVVAQKVIDEENEMIEIFIEPTTIWPGKSEIIIADPDLKPPHILLETAEKA